MTCAHRNKSGAPVFFPAKTLRCLSQYVGFREKHCVLDLCKLVAIDWKKSVYKEILESNWQSFPLFSFFSFFFLYLFSGFYRQSFNISRIFPTPVILGRLRVLSDLNNWTWAIVGCRVFPQFGAWWNCCIHVGSCPLFGCLVSGRYMSLVGHQLYHREILQPGVCSYPLAEETCPHSSEYWGNRDMPSWYSFTTQTITFSNIC